MVKLILETLEWEDAEKRIRLDLKNDDGQKAIDVARSYDHQEIVQMLQMIRL